MSPTPLVNDTAAAPRAIQKGQQAVDPILGEEPKLNGTHGELQVLAALIPAPANGKPASITGNNLFTLDYTGCIVTGGARGLGLCVAQSLLEAGSPYVYCVDILPEPSVKEWQEAEETAAQYGGQIAYRKLDITDQQAVQTVFGQIYDECPIPIAAFFAAAGIQQMIPSLDYPAADFRRIMDVNVTGRPWSHSQLIDRHVLDDSSGRKGDGQKRGGWKHRDNSLHVRLYCQQGTHLSGLQHFQSSSLADVQKRSRRMGRSRDPGQRECFLSRVADPRPFPRVILERR